MKPFPHQYSVSVEANPNDFLQTRGNNTAVLEVAPPVEFGGPGDQWSPEELLMAAIADCLVLSFRAIAKASGFEWSAIECSSEGVLDKVERVVKFTKVSTRVELTIPAGSDPETAEKLLLKAEQTCFVSNSLNCENHLQITISQP